MGSGYFRGGAGVAGCMNSLFPHSSSSLSSPSFYFSLLPSLLPWMRRQHIESAPPLLLSSHTRARAPPQTSQASAQLAAARCCARNNRYRAAPDEAHTHTQHVHKTRVSQWPHLKFGQWNAWHLGQSWHATALVKADGHVGQAKGMHIIRKRQAGGVPCGVRGGGVGWGWCAGAMGPSGPHLREMGLLCRPLCHLRQSPLDLGNVLLCTHHLLVALLAMLPRVLHDGDHLD